MAHTTTWLAGFLLISACMKAPVNTGPSTSSRAFSLKSPTLTPIDPRKENQEKDGIRMVVTPVSFWIERRTTTAFRAVQQMIAIGPNRPVERMEISHPSIEPDHLKFKVRINNRLGRVIRLAGTVVSFQVSGKNVNVPQSQYQEFLSGIILPQQESELELTGPGLLDIIGPDWNRLPGDTATVALLLFDIVTATDAAGNPTRRSNFEYFYRFSMPARADSVVTSVTRLSLSQQTWAAIWQRQGGDQTKWAKAPELDCLPNCLQ